MFYVQDDFLLRHYDSGECQGKLGHSRLSVILHRAQVNNKQLVQNIHWSLSCLQVIGIFAGFAILLLVASPLLLVAAPCLICCKCRLVTIILQPPHLNTPVSGPVSKPTKELPGSLRWPRNRRWSILDSNQLFIIFYLIPIFLPMRANYLLFSIMFIILVRMY